VSFSSIQHDDQELVIKDLQLAALRDEAKCILCLDTVRSATAAKACLHRFCEDCIHRSLRFYSKKKKKQLQQQQEPEPHICCLCRAEIGSEQQLR
jgi:Zinc finger, C3HC4 type (RING finger)